MKQVMMAVILIIATNTKVEAQHTKSGPVPQPVIETFNKKYPNTYVYEWEWDKKKKEYEAEFYLKGIKYEATFSADGRWIKTERDIRIELLPQAVMDSWQQSEYANWKVDDIEEQSTPAHPLFYELELKRKKPKSKAYLYYLPDGSLLKKEEKK